MSATSTAVAEIEERILTLRGRKVLLDSDLAALYGVSTGRLLEAVRRNRARFPADFVFQLSNQEVTNLRSQIAISSLDRPHGGRRFRPYAFTEPIPQPVRATPATETKRPKEVEEELEIV